MKWQVFRHVISTLFYMRETALLVSLAELQGALVLLGYGIELEIQTVCLQKVAAWHHEYEDKSQVKVGIFVAQCRLKSVDTSKVIKPRSSTSFADRLSTAYQHETLVHELCTMTASRWLTSEICTACTVKTNPNSVKSTQSTIRMM